MRNRLSTTLLIFPLVVSLCRLWAQCPDDTLSGQSPLPLSNLLVDYLPVDQITGGPVRVVRICDPESWAAKRPSVIRRAGLLLGRAPELTAGLNLRVLGETPRRGYLEKEIEYDSGTGDRVHAWLLLPEGVSGSSPRPAVMALHGTVAGGAEVTVGRIRARDNRYYGEELAQRGYVVLAPDVISSGRRIYPGLEEFDTGGFDRAFPGWSAMGKMLSDHKRAVDCLISLPEVDSTRIGAIGHSLGGYNAFFLQAFDSRIKAGVSSCGFVAMGASTYPFRFARNEWFVHFPLLRDYIRAGVVPCDMHEVLALCAPRPLFNYSARQDHIFPDFQAVEAPLSQVAELYSALGAADSFIREFGEGDHDFPPEVRERAYRFLDHWLGKD